MTRTAEPQSRLGRRGLAELGRQLSDRDLAIIRSVGELQFMSARQIERMHFPLTAHTPLGAARTSRRVLQRLTTQRVLVRLPRPVGGVRAGSGAYVYALGPVGARLLASHAPRPRYREPSVTFLAHRLAIAELVVELSEAERADLFEVITLEPEPRCWRRYATATGAPVVLKPDLGLVIGRDAYEMHWFVEVDLGTEHLPALVRKCRQYVAALRSGVEQRRIGIFPKALFLMSDDKRVEALNLTLAREVSLVPELFVVRERSRALETLAALPEAAS